MSYTVKQLAKLSGVSARTLHWYDKIDLLKPAYVKSNGYRYYEKNELLILQQILFFKELDFSLNDIAKLLKQTNFNKLCALKVHKSALQSKVDRLHKLMQTVDNTILHIRGKKDMSDKVLYEDFSEDKQAEYENYLVEKYGDIARKRIEQSKKRIANWDSEKWKEILKEGDTIYKDLCKCIEEELPASSEKTQTIMQKHYNHIGRFYDLNDDVYIWLSELYLENDDFAKFFNTYSDKLLSYTVKAMHYYVDK